jgi:UDP-glucose 4-epimerase
MNKPVWITGANGFIGSHLVRSYTSIPVIKFFRTDSSSLIHDTSNFSFPLDEYGIKSAIDIYGYPNQVFHLAGAPTVGQSFQNPHEDFISNVVTTEILLDALSESKTHIIFASSAAVYGDSYDKGIKTNDILLPKSPYGANKIVSEELIKSYVNFFGLSATIVRLFSIYGPGLRKQLLFDCCTKLQNSSKVSPLVLGGTGEELRDWLEITDVIFALQNIERLDQGKIKIYNLGSGSPIKIEEIAYKILSAWSETNNLKPIFNKAKRPGDPFSLTADKSSLPTGFSPSVNIEDGINRYVAWFKNQKS